MVASSFTEHQFTRASDQRAAMLHLPRIYLTSVPLAVYSVVLVAGAIAPLLFPDHLGPRFILAVFGAVFVVAAIQVLASRLKRGPE